MRHPMHFKDIHFQREHVSCGKGPTDAHSLLCTDSTSYLLEQVVLNLLLVISNALREWHQNRNSICKQSRQYSMFCVQVRSVWVLRNRMQQFFFLQGGVAGCCLSAARRCIPVLVYDVNIWPCKNDFMMAMVCARTRLDDDAEARDELVSAWAGHAARMTTPGRM